MDKQFELEKLTQGEVIVLYLAVQSHVLVMRGGPLREAGLLHTKMKTEYEIKAGRIAGLQEMQSMLVKVKKVFDAAFPDAEIMGKEEALDVYKDVQKDLLRRKQSEN